MEDLIAAYKHTRRFLRAYRTLSTDKWERSVLAEMISDRNYDLQWMQTGRQPGIKRGIERRAAYQRERPMDPLLMQAFVANSTAGAASNITDGQRQQIEEALSTLSRRERECYELQHGHCFTLTEIADMLGITKSSVGTHVRRAQMKVLDRLRQ
ncbi:sigma factor-like helix-turn-helix DNA-binding protein [Cohnella sp. GCM10020058]|uniref:sigma factor-like helix-turn-helix DNA-binding protein n=1 Tax=Cohnella sp. GCM10020058 TaxID=3317330 RepID=UPI00362707AC